MNVDTAIARLLATPDWSWRHSSFKAANRAEKAASEVLRAEATVARNWLTAVGAAVAFPLPIGDGTNGPWNRLALVGPEARFGILDIASGILHITDVTAPPEVRRFVLASATSPHAAGGSGGFPAGWGQVALLLGDKADSVSVEARIVERVWGFRTCYGHVGKEPEPADGVRVIETTEPQLEEVYLTDSKVDEVDPEAWAAIMGDIENVSLKPGYMTVGGIRLHRVFAFGTRPERAALFERLRATWIPAAEALAAAPLRELAAAGAVVGSNEIVTWPVHKQGTKDPVVEVIEAVLLRRRQLGLPSLRGLPSGRARDIAQGKLHGFGIVAVRHVLTQLGFADTSLMPPDPTTPEHRAEVARIAGKILATSPKDIALLLRDPSGLPGYVLGANRASYLIEPVVGRTQDANNRTVYAYDLDVEDFPGIEAHRLAVVAEVQALSRALYGRDSGPSGREDVALVRAAGWIVEEVNYYRFRATPPEN